MNKKFVPYDKLTLGQKKVNFVKWLTKEKKVSLKEAKIICGRKFYHETKKERETKHIERLQQCYREGKCVCGMEADYFYDRGYQLGIECYCCK